MCGEFVKDRFPAKKVPLVEKGSIRIRAALPLGGKDIGESGTVGAPPTIINALIDALSPLGVQSIDMPAMPLRVWQAIERAKGKGKAA
jgi:CO/xanthine dehydrogenase Mo-binding subunit